MTDQTFDALLSPPTAMMRAARMRALAPTSTFWLAMFAASALGTNIGDFWADTLGLGLQTSFASLAVICALMIWGDRENGAKSEVFYWLAIVFLRASATNVGDFLTHAAHADFFLAAVVLGAATLVLGYWTRRGAQQASPLIDLRYWGAMFLGGVFGTIAGDLVAHGIGLFFASILLGVVLLVVIRIRGLAAPTTMVGYWCIVLAERAAGTPMGDWLAKPQGLNMGLPVAIVLTASCLFVALALRGGAGSGPQSQAGLAATTRVLLPALRLALFVLSLVGSYCMMTIYFIGHPVDPAFILSYGIGLACNAAYLGCQEFTLSGSSRAARLATLWFAVQRQSIDRRLQSMEAELRERMR